MTQFSYAQEQTKGAAPTPPHRRLSKWSRASLQNLVDSVLSGDNFELGASTRQHLAAPPQTCSSPANL